MSFYSSYHINHLINALIAEIQTARQKEPWRSITIVTPTLTLGNHIKQKITDSQGIYMNVSLKLWRTFLLSLIPPNRNDRPRISNQQRLTLKLYDLFSDKAFLDDPIMAPINNYFSSTKKNDISETLILTHRYQLASTLSTLFETYPVTHPVLIDHWNHNKLLSSNKHERWQQKLWQHLFHETTSPKSSLKPLHDHIKALSKQTSIPSVHIFGFSYVQQGELSVINHLFTILDLNIYYPLFHLPENNFISLKTCLKQNYTALLNASKQTLVELPINHHEHSSQQPASITVTPYKNIRHEVQTITQTIIDLMKTDSSLNFSDIAIGLPCQDTTLYRNHIASCFSGAGNIPITHIQTPLSSTSILLDLINRLFELPLQPLTRDVVIPILNHPALTEHLPHANPMQWRQWIDLLGIYETQDRRKNSYDSEGHFTWERALKRLSLTAFIKHGSVTTKQGQYHSLDEDNVINMGYFISIVRFLLDDILSVQHKKQSLNHWTNFFLKTIDNTYIRPTSDEDRTLLQKIRNEIYDFKKIDVWGNNIEMPYVIAKQFLPQSWGNSISSATVGVAVAPIDELQHRTFDYLFLMGTNEGALQELTSTHSLDLSHLSNESFDNNHRVMKTVHFLSALYGTKHNIFISYKNIHETTGESLLPSSLISNLNYMIVDNSKLSIITPDKVSDETTSLLPFLATQQQAAILQRDIEKQQAISFDNREHIRKLISNQPQIQSILDLYPVSEHESIIKTLSVSLSQLIAFLKNPSEGYMRSVLNVQSEVYSSWALFHESFSLEPKDSSPMLRDIFYTQPYDESSYEKHMALKQHRDQAPIGIFYEADRHKHLECLDQWNQYITDNNYTMQSITVDPLTFTIKPHYKEQEIDITIKESTIHGIVSSDEKDGYIHPIQRSKESLEDHLVGYLYQAILVASDNLSEDKPFDSIVLKKDGKSSKMLFDPRSKQQANFFLNKLLSDLIQPSYLNVSFNDAIKKFTNKSAAQTIQYFPIPHKSTYLVSDEIVAMDPLEDIFESRFAHFFKNIPKSKTS